MRSYSLFVIDRNNRCFTDTPVETMKTRLIKYSHHCRHGYIILRWCIIYSEVLNYYYYYVFNILFNPQVINVEYFVLKYIPRYQKTLK